MANGIAAAAGKSRVAKKVFQSYFYVIVWMSNSIAVILANKWLLAYSGFPFPVTLTLWHMTICSTIGFLCVRVFKVVESHNMPSSEYVRRVLPIGLLYAASLWLVQFCISIPVGVVHPDDQIPDAWPCVWLWDNVRNGKVQAGIGDEYDPDCVWGLGVCRG